jgi:hypothetical protein
MTLKQNEIGNWSSRSFSFPDNTSRILSMPTWVWEELDRLKICCGLDEKRLVNICHRDRIGDFWGAMLQAITSGYSHMYVMYSPAYYMPWKPLKAYFGEMATGDGRLSSSALLTPEEAGAEMVATLAALEVRHAAARDAQDMWLEREDEILEAEIACAYRTGVIPDPNWGVEEGREDENGEDGS